MWKGVYKPPGPLFLFFYTIYQISILSKEPLYLLMSVFLYFQKDSYFWPCSKNKKTLTAYLTCVSLLKELATDLMSGCGVFLLKYSGINLISFKYVTRTIHV